MKTPEACLGSLPGMGIPGIWLSISHDYRPAFTWLYLAAFKACANVLKGFITGVVTLLQN